MRNEVTAILKRLVELEGKIEGYLERAESEDAQDRLQNELDAIQGAIESLENIE